MKMVCKRPNRYGGQKRAFGDEMEIAPRDVRLVTALGWFVPFQEPKKAPPVKAPAAKKAATPATPAEPVPAAVAEAPATAPATPAPTPAPTSAPRADLATRGTYTRRDLTAEP
jgi:hypothetical protein